MRWTTLRGQRPVAVEHEPCHRAENSMGHAVLGAMAFGVLLAGCSSNVGAPPQAPIDWAAFDAGTAAKAPTNAPTAKERGVAEAYAAALGTPAFAQLGPLLDEDAHFSFPGADDARGRSQVVHAH